jgi:hypothetical protein
MVASSQYHTGAITEFLAGVAARERSQGRLSVAALTAASCAAQLEAQCREVLVYRRQAPGPHQVAPLIAGLQGTRERLGVLLDRAVAMEADSTRGLTACDGRLEERLSQEIAHEMVQIECLELSVEGAALIAQLGRLARRVRRLRKEVRGGRPTEEALLGAASVAVVDVIERALRKAHVGEGKLRSESLRALARLRPLCVSPAYDGNEQVDYAVHLDDPVRWN